MGCACLRGGSHHWPDRGTGRVAAGRRQQGGVAHQPDAAGPDARPQLLRRGGNADPIRIGVAKGQRDADADPNGVSDSVGVGQPIGDRDRRRVGDAMPITVCDGVAITVAERQPEALDLALSQAPTRCDPAPGEQDRRFGPVVSASSQRITVLTGRV